MRNFKCIIILLISLDVTADGGFTQNYHGPTTVIQAGPESNKENGIQKEQENKDGNKNKFEQNFYGKTQIYEKDCTAKQVKQQQSVVAPEKQAVELELIPDQKILEEFIKRGLARKIRDGSLFLTCSQGFSELWLALQPDHPSCVKPSSKNVKKGIK
jgi:hypothetical protein